MIDRLSVWKRTFAAIPVAKGDEWQRNMAAWYKQMIAGIEPDPAVLGTTQASYMFVFNESTFAAGLSRLVPTASAERAMASFANAWRSAILASTIQIMPGCRLANNPSPLTTFSTITSPVGLTPQSIALGRDILIALKDAPSVSDPNKARMPVEMRKATLALQLMPVAGLNSIVPPGSPVIITTTIPVRMI